MKPIGFLISHRLFCPIPMLHFLLGLALNCETNLCVQYYWCHSASEPAIPQENLQLLRFDSISALLSENFLPSCRSNRTISKTTSHFVLETSGIPQGSVRVRYSFWYAWILSLMLWLAVSLYHGRRLYRNRLLYLLNFEERLFRLGPH